MVNNENNDELHSWVGPNSGIHPKKILHYSPFVPPVE